MQTVYSNTMTPGFAGLIYDCAFTDKMSYSAEIAVPFGAPVALGFNAERQVTPATLGANVIGIAVATGGIEQSASGVAQYPATETVSVMKRGRIWVNTDDAVLAGAVANLKTSNGKFTDAAVATGIEAITQLKATFITSTTGPGLAVVEIK